MEMFSEPLVCGPLEHTAFGCGLTSAAATSRGFKSLVCSLHGRTGETLMEAASEGRRVFISCFDRLFTVWRCSHLNLKIPV